MAATGSGRNGDVGQSYVERAPVPGLAAVVASVWIQRVGPGAAPYRQLNIPTGGSELTCRLGASPVVAGPLSAPVTDTLPPGTTVVGIRLRPGAAVVAFGLPTRELRDLRVDLAALWGAFAARVAEAVDDAPDPEAASAVLQSHLLARTRGADPPDRLVAAAVHQIRGHVRLTEVGSRLDLSERQLRRRCEAAVGLAPKTLHRVLRFQHFVALSQRELAVGRGPSTVAALAAQAGYADEAHLSRECVRLTGRTPRAFLANAAEQCGCGHDHSASYAPQLAAARPSGGR